MITKKAFLVVFFIYNTLAADLPFDPCLPLDLPCLNRAYQKFNEMVESDSNFTQIDPFMKDRIGVHLQNDEIVVDLKNIKITGVKDLKIEAFEIFYVEKRAGLTLEGEIKFEADVTIKKQEEEPVHDKMSGVVKFSEAAKYEYYLYKDQDGKNHFLMGPAEFTCDIQDQTISVDEEVFASIWSDLKQEEKATKDLICSLIDVATLTVLHNLKLSAKYHPADAYIISPKKKV